MDDENVHQTIQKDAQEAPQNHTCIQKEKKTWKNGSDKQRIYTGLIQSGESPKEAARIAGYGRTYRYQLDKKLEKHSLIHQTRVKKASKVVDMILAGGEGIKKETQLVAARMVYDRLEPVESQAQTAQTPTFIQININDLQNAVNSIQADNTMVYAKIDKIPEVSIIPPKENRTQY